MKKLYTQKIIESDPEVYETIKSELIRQQNQIEFKMIQSDSLKYNIDKPTEVLLIDGYHNPKHIAKELDKYSPWTTQTIILHDTTLFPRLWKSVQNFLSSHQDWKLVYRHTLNAGYTVLGKK